MKLLTGNSNKTLSKNIAKYLKSKLVNSSIRKFADGEIYIEINENIRGNSIFIVQSISSPANDNLMELLLCIDALKRSSAKNITAVIVLADDLFKASITRSSSIKLSFAGDEIDCMINILLPLIFSFISI